MTSPNVYSKPSYLKNKKNEKNEIIDAGDSRLEDITQRIVYKDDFWGSVLPTNLYAIQGSGGTTSLDTEIIGGVLDINTGATDTDIEIIGSKASFSNLFVSDTRFRIRTTSNTNVIYKFGLINHIDSNNHALFIYDTSINTNWQVSADGGAVPYISDTGIPPATTFKEFKIINSLYKSGSVEFFIDNKKVGEGTNSINTIQNTASYWRIYFYAEDLDVSLNHLFVDYIYINQERK